MIKAIIKRNGEVEEFIPGKVNRWAEWSTNDLNGRAEWSSIVLETIKRLPEVVNSQDLQKGLIKTCLLKRDWPHNLMAGKLYVAILRNEMYNKLIPTVKELQTKLINLGLMEDQGYTDEEYKVIEEIIDHSKDFTYAHFQIHQLVKKYSIQDRVFKKSYETPQFIFIRMAMALSKNNKKDRINEIRKFYKYLSDSIINAPTPNYVNLGTKHHGYSSCCLYAVDDTAKSLAIGDHIGYTMTYMSAGIGNNIMCRSIGDPIRKGTTEHQGKFPYYRSLGTAVRANMQSGRGGACTTYYPIFDKESPKLIVAYNPRTPVASQIRDLHFAVMTNRLFAKKVAKNEDIFFFNKFTAPDLTEKLYSGDVEGFEELYNKYEKDNNFKKEYYNARQLLLLSGKESYNVSVHYHFLIDEANRHTPFKDPIYSSNLCVAPETKILTKEGYLTISECKDKEIEVWNGSEWSNTIVRQTGINQKLIKIVTDSGHELECTPYHKFYIIKNYGDKPVEVRAGELSIGDVLIEPNLPQEYKTNTNVITVKSIIDEGRYDDTYCFNEPLKNMGIFNGLLTGQCLEITEPTKPYQDMRDLYSYEDHGRGEVALCNLAAINVANEITDEEYFEACYYSLIMIDETIHLNHYELPHIGVTAKNRLNAGVGMIGFATHMARKGLKFNTKEGLQEIHRVAERHAYFMIKASLQLGKERGNAPWMHKTKWPDGWLPIDTYKKQVDELAEPIYNYDWEQLRKEIIANKGIRNSTLIAHMPTESSSKASGVPNGIYPIRDLHLKKTDQKNVLDWCPVDGDLIGKQYQIAYDIPTVDLIKAYSVFQKFTDQSISADFYKDRTKKLEISDSEIINEYLAMVKYGLKSRYYQNSLTSKAKEEEIIHVVNEPKEIVETNKEDEYGYSNTDNEKGCAGGTCTL